MRLGDELQLVLGRRLVSGQPLDPPLRPGPLEPLEGGVSLDRPVAVQEQVVQPVVAPLMGSFEQGHRRLGVTRLGGLGGAVRLCGHPVRVVADGVGHHEEGRLPQPGPVEAAGGERQDYDERDDPKRSPAGVAGRQTANPPGPR